MASSKDVRRLKDYKRLYNMGFSAAGKLYALANDSDDAAQRKALRAQAGEITDFMYRLRRAQLVELTAPQGQGPTPAQRLKKAVATAESRLDELENLATALKAASELFDMATRLFKLVT